MEEVQPLGAVYIHRCPQHLLRETLRRSHIRCAHGKVAEGDLNMEWSRDNMADHDIHEPIPSTGNRQVADQIPIPECKGCHSNQLKVSIPCCLALLGASAIDEVVERETVKVEAAEAENRVVHVVLDRNEHLCKLVIPESRLIEG